MRRVLAAVAAAMLTAALTRGAEASDALVTGSLPPRASVEETLPAPPAHLLVLGFAGDIGFTGHGDVPRTDGAVKHGAVIPWDRFTGGISPLLNADANFANLETVIAEDHGLTPIEKSFNFMGDPEGLRQTIAAGFTVLTAANNHAGDFGALGIVETLAHLAAAKSLGLKAFAGLGIGTDRYQPGVFDLRGIRIGIAAIGIGFNHAGPDGPGQPLYASPQDFNRVAAGLAASGASVRVLSVHYGKELVSLPLARDRARLRAAIDSHRAGIVFGHHSHVPSGVEFRNGGVIFYGLGNFMHTGTQDMSRYGSCRDFGLYAKAYLWLAPGEAPVIRALELLPVRGMHAVPEAMPPAEASKRIAIVNAMNVAVAEAGVQPVRFDTTGNGAGLACFGDQPAFGDELSARCKAAAGPRAASPLVDRTLPASCGFEPPPPPREEVVAAPPPVVPPVAKIVPRKLPKSQAAAAKPRQKSLFGLKFFD